MFQARERHNFLHQFPNGWPVEEFLKTYLKNKRAYARKRGYLTVKTNQKQDQDDEEEEQDKDIEEHNGSGKGQSDSEHDDDDMY